MYKGILPDPNIRGDVLPSVLATACIGAARSKLGLFSRGNARNGSCLKRGESNLSKIHGWLIEHCLNIYVAKLPGMCE